MAGYYIQWDNGHYVYHEVFLTKKAADKRVRELMTPDAGLLFLRLVNAGTGKVLFDPEKDTGS